MKFNRFFGVIKKFVSGRRENGLGNPNSDEKLPGWGMKEEKPYFVRFWH
jgi:hypothetical protein